MSKWILRGLIAVAALAVISTVGPKASAQDLPVNTGFCWTPVTQNTNGSPVEFGHYRLWLVALEGQWPAGSPIWVDQFGADTFILPAVEADLTDGRQCARWADYNVTDVGLAAGVRSRLERAALSCGCSVNGRWSAEVYVVDASGRTGIKAGPIEFIVRDVFAGEKIPQAPTLFEPVGDPEAVAKTEDPKTKFWVAWAKDCAARSVYRYDACKRELGY